ncbi:MAG: hypothetical protein EBU49_00805 [Proteobacteria bacterium]|nr:hypothetical protein [Pseudomonadota bacterium]
MINTILASAVVASCLDGGSYFGGTRAELTRSADESTYNLLIEEFKGPDGDGRSGVVADETTSSMSAIHLENGMLYQFKGWELEVFGVYTQPYSSKLDGELRKFNSSGEVVSKMPMTCDFND